MSCRLVAVAVLPFFQQWSKNVKRELQGNEDEGKERKRARERKQFLGHKGRWLYARNALAVSWLDLRFFLFSSFFKKGIMMMMRTGRRKRRVLYALCCASRFSICYYPISIIYIYIF